MKIRSADELIAINRRLKASLVVVSTLLIIAFTFLTLMINTQNASFNYVGGPISTPDATSYVKSYTGGFFVGDKSTTSFLLERAMLDSLVSSPATASPIYYRLFFAKDAQNNKTLVITGAILTGTTITNTHIKGGYDIEHVFPIDNSGNVYEVDAKGNRKKVWTANRFPDDSN